jgi:hypothetical protein
MDARIVHILLYRLRQRKLFCRRPDNAEGAVGVCREALLQNQGMC